MSMRRTEITTPIIEMATRLPISMIVCSLRHELPCLRTCWLALLPKQDRRDRAARDAPARVRDRHDEDAWLGLDEVPLDEKADCTFWRR
jgi:hypothetical protein